MKKIPLLIAATLLIVGLSASQDSARSCCPHPEPDEWTLPDPWIGTMLPAPAGQFPTWTRFWNLPE